MRILKPKQSFVDQIFYSCKLVSLFIITLIVISCGKTTQNSIENSALKSDFNKLSSNNYQALKTTLKIAEKPYTQEISADFWQKDNRYFYFKNENNIECFSRNRQYIGEIAIILGPHEGVVVKGGKDYQEAFFNDIKSIAMSTDRLLCFYPLEQVEEASKKNQVEFLIYFGHGTDEGDLSVIEKVKSMSPEEFPKFTQKTLVMADFVSCQTGLKYKSWERRFPSHTIVNTETKKVKAQDALNYLHSEYIDALIISAGRIDCQELQNRKDFLERIKQLGVEDRCY